jgi:hypothetical protein
MGTNIFYYVSHMHDRKFPKHKLQMPAPHKRLSKDNRKMDVNTGKVIPSIKSASENALLISPETA